MRLFATLIDTIKSVLYRSASEYLEEETEEMEHLFALLSLGFLVGYPVIPPSLSLKLMPYLEKEVALLLDRAYRLDDQIGIIGFDIE